MSYDSGECQSETVSDGINVSSALVLYINKINDRKDIIVLNFSLYSICIKVNYNEIIVNVKMKYNFCHSYIYSYSKEKVLENYDSTKAVLLIHGFGASPHVMLEYGNFFHLNGYHVLILRLPGHGQMTLDDFYQCKAIDWQRKVHEAYLQLSVDFKNIVIAGHSMGSLLAIQLAFNFSIDKIILLTPALVINDKRISLLPILQFFIKRVIKKTDTKVTDNPYNEIEELYNMRVLYKNSLSVFYFVKRDFNPFNKI